MRNPNINSVFQYLRLLPCVMTTIFVWQPYLVKHEEKGSEIHSWILKVRQLEFKKEKSKSGQRVKIHYSVFFINFINFVSHCMSILNTKWRCNLWLNWCIARNIFMISVLIECYKGYIFSFQYRNEIFFSSLNQVTINQVAFSENVP